MVSTDRSSEITTGYQTLTITSISEEVAGVKIFTFREMLPYKAGQYLTLLHHSPQGEIRRSYSITSSPVLHEPLAIGVKRIENGYYSRQLVDHAQVGDMLHTTGAGGLFTLPNDIQHYRQIFFLAAGSGITPIFSLLKTALHAYQHLHLVLLYSNRSPEHTMFLQPLKELAAAYPDQLHIEFIFSNSADLSRARLHKDLLQTFVDQHARAPYKQMLFYLCGPLNYMRLSSFALRQHGIPADNIRREIFHVDKTIPPKLVPPDTDAHQVVITIDGVQQPFESKFPLTILQSARKAGITLPYSCDAGKCGNCVARVLKGEVWMSYNEVLTERDLQQGMVLTCVGCPVGGDVTLEIQ